MTPRPHQLRSGFVAGCLVAALLAPAPAAAQRATGTLIVRVQQAGAPAAGVEIGVVLDRIVQPVGTTGSSGLVAVEQLALDIQTGTRMSVGILACGDEGSVLLIPQYESLGEVPAGCEQLPAGSFFWGQAERIVVQVEGGEAIVQDTQTEELRSTLTGWRAQVSFLFTSLGGEEFDFEKDGIGADAKLFYLWHSGLGLGGGVSWTVHDVLGIDENLYKWSVYLEPRYTLFIPSTKLRPYVLGRVSYNWFAYQGGVRLGESGFGFGGGLGAAYPIASWLALDLGAYFGYLSVSTDFEGATYTRDGTEIQLTAGLRLY